MAAGSCKAHDILTRVRCSSSGAVPDVQLTGGRLFLQWAIGLTPGLVVGTPVSLWEVLLGKGISYSTGSWVVAAVKGDCRVGQKK